MPLSQTTRASVVERCIACSGAGHTLKTASPITFRLCWMCYGQRGQTALLYKDVPRKETP